VAELAAAAVSGCVWDSRRLRQLLRTVSGSQHLVNHETQAVESVEVSILPCPFYGTGVMQVVEL